MPVQKVLYRVNPCFKLVKTDYDMSRNCIFYYYEQCGRMGQPEPNSEGGPNFRISIVGNEE